MDYKSPDPQRKSSEQRRKKEKTQGILVLVTLVQWTLPFSELKR